MTETMHSAGKMPANLPPGALLRPLRAARGLPKGALLRAIGHGAIGATEATTGRTVLHQSPRPEVTQAAATAEHPAVREQIENLLGPIDGAKLAGARDAKDPDRVEEKVEDGQSPRTVRDFSGFRISVETPEARPKVVSALKGHFEVPDEQDEFEKGNAETGFHGHTLQVRESGSPVSHEVQVLPREVAEHADAQHALYEKARGGDKGAASQMKAANESDWKAFQSRNGAKPPVRYKLGNTQANIGSESNAAKALNKHRAAIPEGHLAGDGRDVGDGGHHVTLRYGIQGDDTAGIESYLKKQPPFTARLGQTEVFPPSEHSEGAAPLVARVESPELVRMNAEIERHGDFAKPSFADYKPHATIAYLDPKRTKEHGGKSDLAGADFPVNAITISDRHGNQKEVRLEGRSGAKYRFQRMADARKPAAGEGKTAQNMQKQQIAQKGAVVLLPDGQAGVVKHVHAGINGGPERARVRLASGETRSSVKPEDMKPAKRIMARPDEPWDGFDVDGTLAHYDGWKGEEVIGPPVKEMTDRVKQMLADGKNVRLFTARVASDPTGKARQALEAWSAQYLGAVLPITNVKDAKMERLWDDRAVQVRLNTGKPVGGDAALKDAEAAHKMTQK